MDPSRLLFHFDGFNVQFVPEFSPALRAASDECLMQRIRFKHPMSSSLGERCLRFLWRIQLRDHFCVAQNWISYQFEASNRLSVFVSDAIDVGGFHEACNPVEHELSSSSLLPRVRLLNRRRWHQAHSGLPSPFGWIKITLITRSDVIQFPENLIETMSNMWVDPRRSFCFIKMFNRILLSRFEYFCGAFTSNL